MYVSKGGIMTVLSIPLVCIFTMSILESYPGLTGLYDWAKIRRSVTRKFRDTKLLNKNMREYPMDFLEACESARNGIRVRRKEWLPKGSAAWHGKLVYVWWDSKYKCLLAAGPYVPLGGQQKFKDTEGYTYVCEGDDMQATDWELTPA